MRSQAIRRHIAPWAAAILALLAVLAGTGALALRATSASADSGLQVYVGYMDTHSQPVPSPNSPSPWPYTDPASFIGTACPQWPTSSAYNVCWDAAAIRLVNTTSSPVSGVSVKVVISNGTTTKTYSPWGGFTVQANGQMVLTETSSGNFDLSDKAPNSYNGGNTASCVNSGANPVVNVTAGGVTTGYTDTGQVLDTSGVDTRHCVNGVFTSAGKNESEPWTQVPAGSSTTTSPSPSPSPTTTSPSPSPSPTTTSPSPSPSPTTTSPSPSPSPTTTGPGFAFGGNVGYSQGSMTSASVTVPAGGVPAGSLVVVGIASPTAPESFTVSDSAGNAYILDNSRTSSSPYGYQFHSLTSAALPQGATISVQWGGASIDAVIEATWFSTGYATVTKDLALSGHSSGTALSTGNTKATAYANELVVGMGSPRMPGTATYSEDTADGYSQAVFTGDSKQSNDLSYKVVPSTGVFDYKPTISVSSSWVDLLTTYHGS